MKNALMIDYQVLRPMLRQHFVTAIIIALVIAMPMGSLYSIIPTVTLAASISAGFTVMALDEQNNWEAFRAVLPVTRRDIMFGRMLFVAVVAMVAMVIGVIASVLVSVGFPLIDATWGRIVEMDPSGYVFEVESTILSCGFSLIIVGVFMCVTLPLVAKFGMTKAVRFVPLAMCCVAFPVVGMLASMSAFSGPDSVLGSLLASSPAPVGLFLMIVAVVLLAIGAVLASKLYQKREF